MSFMKQFIQSLLLRTISEKKLNRIRHLRLMTLYRTDSIEASSIAQVDSREGQDGGSRWKGKKNYITKSFFSPHNAISFAVGKTSWTERAARARERRARERNFPTIFSLDRIRAPFPMFIYP